ncbi:CLUMA_CG002720, isoform A [Clunio marinus]|uniref:CLUMA_CG002720, isoform A n=1 Tax=Clunio marinus TaxID=568069 RepID=A0A1J1HLW6_9DIPT|nr:CLUMA_CG002720, isoform A [Clunio marinus]
MRHKTFAVCPPSRSVLTSSVDHNCALILSPFIAVFVESSSLFTSSEVVKEFFNGLGWLIRSICLLSLIRQFVQPFETLACSILNSNAAISVYERRTTWERKMKICYGMF